MRPKALTKHGAFAGTRGRQSRHAGRVRSPDGYGPTGRAGWSTREGGRRRATHLRGEDLEAGGEGEGGLAVVEGDEVGLAEFDGAGDVEDVERTRAQGAAERAA